MPHGHWAWEVMGIAMARPRNLERNTRGECGSRGCGGRTHWTEKAAGPPEGSGGTG